MADLTVKGFDLADKYRMTTMILADGTMGQMMEPVCLDYEVKETVDKPWATTGTKLEREHNIVTSLFLNPDELEDLNFERFERYKYIEENEAMYEEYMMDDAEIAKNAINEARKQGIKVGLIRPITLWPFPTAPFKKAANQVKEIISVELSMGQMIEDVRLASECKVPVTLCNRTGGMIPSPEQVLEAIKKANGGAK